MRAPWNTFRPGRTKIFTKVHEQNASIDQMCDVLQQDECPLVAECSKHFHAKTEKLKDNDIQIHFVVAFMTQKRFI